MREIPLSVPNLSAACADNLRECVETGWVSTGGRFISEFEEKVARFVGAEAAVGCQSGTAGLHTALRILGVEPGDEVLVPTLTFIAAVNPVRYQFAEPIFIDCADNLCMDADKLEKFCREECELKGDVLFDKKNGKRVKAIVVVHVLGNLANMGKVMEVAEKYRLKVLEDATEALGCFWKTGKFANKHAGRVGDIGVFSFNANKIITTGGGGMLVAKSAADLQRARYLTTTAKDDALFFAHDDVGYNYRMLNLQAALGVSQMDDLPGFIETKKSNFSLYKELLDGAKGVHFLEFAEDIESNHWFYSLVVDDAEGGEAGGRRNALMHALIERGIACRPIWKLVHTQKPYAGFRAFEVEKAQYYEVHVLNLPCSTNLSEEDVCDVCANIKQCLVNL